MRRLLLAIFICIVAPLMASATTTVTGTSIADANGNLYANGTVSALLILQTGQPIPAGAVLSSGPFVMNSAGSFSISLFSPATYTFTICGTATNIGPRGNAQPNQICFTTVPIVISGASQDITSSFGVPVPLLGPAAPGTGGANPAGNNGDLQSKNGTALQASGINDNGKTVSIARDLNGLQGPNPWYDLSAYGTMAASTAGYTGAINSGSTALTLSGNLPSDPAWAWNLGGGFGTPIISITGGTLSGNSSGAQNVASYQGAGLMGPDMYVQGAVSASGGNQQLVVRLTFNGSSAETGYECQANVGQLYNIAKEVAGTYTGLSGNIGGATVALNDVVKCQVQGNTISAFANGVLVAQVTDSSITGTGYPGVRFFSTGGGLNTFSASTIGGAAVTIPITTMLNGNGVRVDKAGAATTLTTPTAGTCTVQGIINGATSHTYTVFAEDIAGGLTASATACSTTTSPATIGRNSATITQAVDATTGGGARTYTTSAAHNFAPGVTVYISGFSGGFNNINNGSKTIVSTPTATTFTTNDGYGTGLTDGSGGTGTVMGTIRVTWGPTNPPQAGAIHYWVCRDNTVIGVAQGVDPVFVDQGLAAPSLPSYVPSTCPVTAQPGYLTAKILSGGTQNSVSFTLDTAAGTTVSANSTIHDNTPLLKAAWNAATASGQAGTVVIPNVTGNPAVSGNTVFWPFNSGFTFSSGANSSIARVLLRGQPCVNQPWVVSGAQSVEFLGDPGPSGTLSFIPAGGPELRVCGSAYPIFLLHSNVVNYKNIYCSPFFGQQSCVISEPTTPGGQSGYEIGFVSSTMLGQAGLGTDSPYINKNGAFSVWRDVQFAMSGATDSLAPPSVRFTNASFNTSVSIGGAITTEGANYFVGRGFSIDTFYGGTAGATSGNADFHNWLAESMYGPLFTIGNVNNTLIDQWSFYNIVDSDRRDAIGTCELDGTQAGVFGLINFTIVNWSTASSTQNRVCGPFYLFSPTSSGQSSGQQDFITSSMTTKMVSSNPELVGGTATQVHKLINVAEVGSGPAFWGTSQGHPLAPPTLSLAAGGSVPIGTHTYSCSWQGPNVGESLPSPQASITTTTGNQKVNITCNGTLPAGARGWFIYRDGTARANMTQWTAGCSTPFTGAFPLADTSATVFCGQSPSNEDYAAYPYMNQNGLGTPGLTLGSGSTMTGSSGNGGIAQETTSAAKTVNDIAQYDANGNVIDSAIPLVKTGAIGQGQVLCANSLLNITNCNQGVVPNAQTGTSYTIGNNAGTNPQADNSKYITFSNAAAIAVTVPVASAVGFPNSFFLTCDIGAGTATFTPTTSTVSYTDGSTYTSAATSLALTTGQCAWWFNDGTNYSAIVRKGGGTGGGIPYGTGAGTAQAQTVASSTPTVTALTTGIYVSWLPVANNTGAAPTLAYDGLAATTVVGPDGNALSAGDISTANVALAEYNGTNFVLLNPRNQVTSTGSFKCIGNPCFFASSNSNVTLQAGTFGSVTLNDGTDNYFFANRSSNNITSSTGDSTSGTSIEFDLQTTAPATNPNQVITTGLKATAALTAGQVVKLDTANANSVVVAATTDTGAGVVLGFVVNSPGAAATAKIAIPGSIINTPLLGTGTCAIGNFVIVDTTTGGRVKCTATFTAGTILGYATAAQSTVGSAVTTYVLPR